ncbi:MAG: 2Fe-2S iron-sulfur cluster-binding protein [Gammaproteobacteria bacterium]|nr:2Fe-2S iron-sulfur cluster-binding protein [Gammaproteobacteria bacterium]
MPKVTLSALNHVIELPEGTALTELDNLLMFGCRLGVCGACVMNVTEGEKNLSPKQEDEREFLEMLGYVEDSDRLACQCLVFGDVTIKQF